MSNPAHRHHPLLVIILLGILPPMAWVMLWQDKTYHSWFAYLLWIYGLSALLTSAAVYLFVLPKFLNLVPKSGLSASIFLAAGVGLIELAFGYYLHRVSRRLGHLADWQILVTLFLQMIQFTVLPFFLANSLAGELYSLTSQP